MQCGIPAVSSLKQFAQKPPAITYKYTPYGINPIITLYSLKYPRQKQRAKPLRALLFEVYFPKNLFISAAAVSGPSEPWIMFSLVLVA